MPDTKSPRYKQLRGMAFFGMFAIVAALAVYSIFAPKPPTQLKALAKYSGTITVSHEQAILNAQLVEHSAKYVVETLGKCKFFTENESIDFTNGLHMVLSKGIKIDLVTADSNSFACVTNGTDRGVYRLNKPVYEEILKIVYDSFPNGVQVLDLQPWWEEYLALASFTLLGDDFNSPKEIPTQGIVYYTFYQMLADGSLADFESTDKDGKRINIIPYQLFLTRAKEYFADGAGPEIKKSNLFDSSTNCFVFAAMPAEFVGNYPYTNYSDYRQNNYFSLRSLTRDLSGNITAVFEDYNRAGFRERGTLNRIHNLTMVSSSDGHYRFVSKSSSLATPMNTSVEGYFMRLVTIGAMSAENVFDSGTRQGGTIGANYLLFNTKYTKDKARLELYTVNPRNGDVVAQTVVESDPTTVFFDIKTTNSGVIVKTNRGATLFDDSLTKTESISLPLEIAPSLRPLGYDVTDKFDKLVFTDNAGLFEMDIKNQSVKLLAEHPSTQQSAADIKARFENLSKVAMKYNRPVPEPTPPPVELLSNPMYTNHDRTVLVAHTDKTAISCYSSIDLTDEKPLLCRLDIVPLSGAIEYTDGEKLVVQFPNSIANEGEAVHDMIQIVHLFESGRTTSFSLELDTNASSSLIYGDFIYFFKRLTLPEGGSTGVGDAVFHLHRAGLKNGYVEQLPIQIVNAIPTIISADSMGRVLFSYRSSAGSGFGISMADSSAEEIPFY